MIIYLVLEQEAPGARHEGIYGPVNVLDSSSTTSSFVFPSSANCENSDYFSVACAFKFADQIK